MKHPLAELVNVILQRLEDKPDTRPSEKRMRTWLARQGYNERDVDAAIQLVWPRILAAKESPTEPPRTLRHLSSDEAHKLSPESRAALARLDLYDLIEPYEREMILERLGQIEGEVTMDDLDYLLSWVMHATRDVESQQVIFDVFEGDQMTLH